MAGSRVEKKLNALRVKNLKEPGTYEDGGGLRLWVRSTGAKQWVLRVSIQGNRRELGLGSYPGRVAGRRRTAALEYRKAARDGVDLKAEEKKAEEQGTTFRQAFDEVLTNKKRQLSNAKHLAQWSSTMEAYVFPSIGDTPVAEVTGAQVIAMLQPIWYDKPETAKRVLQRMSVVFDAAILKAIREKANPCTGVADHFGVRHREVVHHASMPWKKVPAFITLLKRADTQRWPVTTLAFEFLILTATRSGETRGAVWTEFDLKTATWSIPKARMKARQDHRVPLSKRCLEILKAAKALNPDSALVFPLMSGTPLSDMTLTKVLRDLKIEVTAHGFRSSFKDWSAKSAMMPDDVSEAVLAHKIKDKTKAAYKRTDFLDQRRPAMEKWAKFCCG